MRFAYVLLSGKTASQSLNLQDLRVTDYDNLSKVGVVIRQREFQGFGYRSDSSHVAGLLNVIEFLTSLNLFKLTYPLSFRIVKHKI